MTKKNIFLFISILIGTLFAGCKEKAKDVKVTGTTRIEWVDDLHNFGDVKEGETVLHSFKFKNVGYHPLVISKIETTCGCTEVSKPEAPIAVGEMGKIEVAFNTSGRSGKQFKQISIFANIPNKETKVMITAMVK